MSTKFNAGNGERVGGSSKKTKREREREGGRNKQERKSEKEGRGVEGDSGEFVEISRRANLFRR